jgi:beta-N-acetylhexosaminidase
MQQIATREDVRRAVGNRLICGLPGTSFDAESKEILREINPLGIILFARNVESPEQICELSMEIKSWQKDKPILISVDQEGGRVARIKSPATQWPAARTLGSIDDVKLTQNMGQALGKELRAMNIDLSFAPVLDVDTNADNPVIGDRSFSSDPLQVSRHAIAFANGLQEAKVAGCGKHFPGHGDTHLDSHFALPHIEHELERIKEIEWTPFKNAVAAGFEAIMSAHVVLECIDPKHPATLSHKVIEYLRQDIGFDGILFSDDLDMKALADNYAAQDIAQLGTEAGIDCFLACNDPTFLFEFYRSLIQLVETQKLSHVDLLKTETRLIQFRDKHTYAPTSWKESKSLIGCPAHKDLVQEAQDRHRSIC